MTFKGQKMQGIVLQRRTMPSKVSWEYQQQCRSLSACPYATDSLEYQARLILDRVETTQFNFGNLCRIYASYSRRIGEIRDGGDELSRAFSQFTEVQSCCCPQTKKAITEFAHALATVQDYEQARISRIEAKVISGFAKYGFLCHTIKDEVQKGLHIREREQRQTEQYLRLQSDISLSEPRRQQKLESANMAANDSKRAQELLQRRSDKFEQQKLEDMRRVLLNFCEIEIAYHARVIELYSHAYNELLDVDIDMDLDTFRMELQIGPNYMTACETIDELKANFQKEGIADGIPVSSTHSMKKPEDEIFSDSNISAEPLDGDDIVKCIRGKENQTARCVAFFGEPEEEFSDGPSNMALVGSNFEERQVSSRTSVHPGSGSTLLHSKLSSSQSLLEQLATKDSHRSYKSMRKKVSSRSLPSSGRKPEDRRDIATGMSKTEKLLQQISTRNLAQLHPSSAASLRKQPSRPQLQQQQSSSQWYPSEVSNGPRTNLSKTKSDMSSTYKIAPNTTASVTTSKIADATPSRPTDVREIANIRKEDDNEQDLKANSDDGTSTAPQVNVSVNRNDKPLVSDLAHRLSVKSSKQLSEVVTDKSA
ncbi:uncharacterized protein LOC129590140 [Paramacrobiotus metropolitanus]|uniref:uncharacterized protein LOC129590140 n=1 Tax=Paramacrobiotus metropolitanus TaxID=2943436 RepID=UPI00244645B9|nr:uncharacterized protein LOC129590140 [Paramacrobiotus metropolitanus]